MKLTLNKLSALRLLRIARKRRGKRGIPRTRVELATPDPSPRSRWSRQLFESALEDWDPQALCRGKLNVCVSDEGERLGSRLVSNTIYADALPSRSFMPLGGSGLFIPCPELLFIELAPIMTLPAHLQLGFELCGGYARDAQGPIQGPATFDLPPVTSVERIGRYLSATGRIAGKPKAKRTLRLLSDNAWSPMEATIATMMALPLEENGYGFGRCVLNRRIPTFELLKEAAKKESRVPDILVAGTHVGINYDGEYHLDLGALEKAARESEREPGNRWLGEQVERTKAQIRAQVIDDSRRDRELLVDGCFIFRVFKEDLYDEIGLDGIMMQVLQALRMFEGWRGDGRLELISSSAARRERRELLSSMLPGRTHRADAMNRETIIRFREK